MSSGGGGLGGKGPGGCKVRCEHISTPGMRAGVRRAGAAIQAGEVGGARRGDQTASVPPGVTAQPGEDRQPAGHDVQTGQLGGGMRAPLGTPGVTLRMPRSGVDSRAEPGAS